MIYDIRVEVEEGPYDRENISRMLRDHAYDLIHSPALNFHGGWEDKVIHANEADTICRLTWRSRLVDYDYPLREALADIAYIAGNAGYHGSDDSREDTANFIAWAQEFETMHRGTRWGEGEEANYLDAIDAFAAQKMDSFRPVIQPRAPALPLPSVAAHTAAIERLLAPIPNSIIQGAAIVATEPFTFHNFYNHDEANWDKLAHKIETDDCPICGEKIEPMWSEEL